MNKIIIFKNQCLPTLSLGVGHVLAQHRVFQRHRLNGLQHFHLLVPEVLGAEADRLFCKLA
jgi:hypothetical protein